mmetsp:Transcript_32475/g.85908  ORF Transcript_32475/g.85908 Transcript_32475/m.85908 type:complete len:461 (-) Transcript_32475:68-1450(-)
MHCGSSGAAPLFLTAGCRRRHLRRWWARVGNRWGPIPARSSSSLQRISSAPPRSKEEVALRATWPIPAAAAAAVTHRSRRRLQRELCEVFVLVLLLLLVLLGPPQPDQLGRRLEADTLRRRHRGSVQGPGAAFERLPEEDLLAVLQELLSFDQHLFPLYQLGQPTLVEHLHLPPLRISLGPDPPQLVFTVASLLLQQVDLHLPLSQLTAATAHLARDEISIIGLVLHLAPQGLHLALGLPRHALRPDPGRVLAPQGGSGVLQAALRIHCFISNLLRLQTGILRLHVQGIQPLPGPALLELQPSDVACMALREVPVLREIGAAILQDILQLLQLPAPLLRRRRRGRLRRCGLTIRRPELRAPSFAAEAIEVRDVVPQLGVELFDLLVSHGEAGLQIRDVSSVTIPSAAAVSQVQMSFLQLRVELLDGGNMRSVGLSHLGPELKESLVSLLDEAAQNPLFFG